MRVIDAMGKQLDASCLVESDGGQLVLIMDSRGGGGVRGGRPWRNPDYNDALELLLERLGQMDATLLDALVDSRNTQRPGTPEEKRRLIRALVKADEVEAQEAEEALLAARGGRADSR
jgi:hypothetical protein